MTKFVCVEDTVEVSAEDPSIRSHTAIVDPVLRGSPTGNLRERYGFREVFCLPQVDLIPLNRTSAQRVEQLNRMDCSAGGNRNFPLRQTRFYKNAPAATFFRVAFHVVRIEDFAAQHLETTTDTDNPPATALH